MKLYIQVIKKTSRASATQRKKHKHNHNTNAECQSIIAPDFSRRPVPVLFHRQQRSVEEGRLVHARQRHGSGRPKLFAAAAAAASAGAVPAVNTAAAPAATTTAVVAAAAVSVPLPWTSGIRAETTLIVLFILEIDSAVARPVPLLRPLALVAVAMARRAVLVGLLRT